MKTIHFEIPGKPTPWKRMGRNGDKYFPQKGQISAKKAIALSCKSAMNKAGISCAAKGEPVALTVYAVFKLPQRLPKGDLRRMGSRHTQTPDADNITKLVKDALNKVAYHDDAQVFQISTTKQWSDRERTAITLEFLV